MQNKGFSRAQSEMTCIAIVGSGHVGGTLGQRLAQAGHEVIFGSRHPSAAKIERLVSDSPGSRADTNSNAVSSADVVILATPWDATREIVSSLGDFHRKVLIDCTNPIGEGLTLTHSGTTSGGEQVAHWAHNARVVKCFNHVGFEIMAQPEVLRRHQICF